MGPKTRLRKLPIFAGIAIACLVRIQLGKKPGVWVSFLERPRVFSCEGFVGACDAWDGCDLGLERSSAAFPFFFLLSKAVTVWFLCLASSNLAKAVFDTDQCAPHAPPQTWADGPSFRRAFFRRRRTASVAIARRLRTRRSKPGDQFHLWWIRRGVLNLYVE